MRDKIVNYIQGVAVGLFFNDFERSNLCRMLLLMDEKTSLTNTLLPSMTHTYSTNVFQTTKLLHSVKFLDVKGIVSQDGDAQLLHHPVHLGQVIHSPDNDTSSPGQLLIHKSSANVLCIFVTG